MIITTSNRSLDHSLYSIHYICLLISERYLDHILDCSSELISVVYCSILTSGQSVGSFLK